MYLLRGRGGADGLQLAAAEQLITPAQGRRITGLDASDWDGDGTPDLIGA